MSIKTKKILCCGVICVLAFAPVFCMVENSKLHEEIAAQAEELRAANEELRTANRKIGEVENAFYDLYDSYALSKERLTAANRENDSLRESKMIPVYHCNHSESSIVSLIYSFLDNMPSYVDGWRYENEQENIEGYVVDKDFANDYADWWRIFAEETGYWENLEYEWYFGD